ncbi:MAG: hypothetical protein GEV09_06335 [Pseudonocardiaceae bacterium]|nr:hypothetical protein [Pseudonocardiaceae bacterium]
MKITFLGQESGDKGCPTIYATDRDTYLVQGWRVGDAEALADMDVPDHETVVEVPRGLLRLASPEA